MLTRQAFQVAAQVAETDLLDMPIDPAWVVAGDPTATGALPLSTADGACGAGVWRCTPGEFDWRYVWDEFSLILEGRVTLRGPDGRETTVVAGDLVSFQQGTTVRWRVEETVRKVFVLRTAGPEASDG